MPDATITSTASTFGTISGTFAADQSTVTGTVTGIITGTLSGSVGVPGPQGPAGSPGATGPAGPQGEPGAPGQGVPVGGTSGQVLYKTSSTDYATDWTSLGAAAYQPLSYWIQSPAVAAVDGQIPIWDEATSRAVWSDNSAVTLTATVRNETGATLSKGTVVYINGGAGNKPLVVKASASTEASSSKTFAILSQDISTNQNGQAVTMGLLKGLDTTAFSAGANLWLSTTAGEITSTPPTSPDHAVFLGNAVRIHATQGEIEVRIQNGYELGELHDVLLTSPTNGQVLKYDSASGLWVNGTDVGGVAWGGITGTLSDQTDLQSALDAKQSVSGMSAYLTKAGNLTGLTDLAAARDNLQLGTLNTPTFAGVTVQGSGANIANLTATSLSLTHATSGSFVIQPSVGITFPDATVQTTAYPGPAGATAWGTITGTLSSQTDLQTALDGKYSTSNPAGYITSSALAGYATESFVTSQGYITSSALTGYATESWVTSQGYLTSASLSGYATESWVTAGFYPLTGNPSGFLTSASLSGYATESWVTSQLGSYLTTSAAASTYLTQSNAASTYQTIAGMSSYLTTSSAASTYAPIASPTFTGLSTFNNPGNYAITIDNTAGYYTSISSGVYSIFNASTEVIRLASNGIKYPDGVTQTVAYPGPSGFLLKADNLSGLASVSTARTNLGLGTMATATAADYSTTSVANGLYYPLSSNPAGYLTSASLSGYATESWVTSQGYITSSALTPYLTSATAASTYQTISGMSSYLTTSAAASTYLTQSNAASTYQTISGMSSYLTTSAAASTYLTQSNAASTYFTIANAANKADLASPVFTGTPTAPTATSGTNTTQIATTAFVQQEVPAASTTAAGKVELATFVESTRFNTQTLATTPQSLLGLIAANGGAIRPRSSAFTAASSGAGASAASYYGATICYGPNASTVGYAGVYYDAGGLWASNNAYTTPDWSKVTGFSVMAYRPSIGFTSGNTIRITLGKAASGGTLSTRGIGVDIAAANTYAKILAHNGTTLTTTDSTFLVSNYANLSTRNITMVSYGNGTVEMFVNGVSYGTSSGGPTTAGGTGTRYSEEVYGDGTQSSAMQLWTFNASVFTGL